jgi:hypothetical protein
MISAFGFLPISNVHIDLDHKEFSITGEEVDKDYGILERALDFLNCNHKYTDPLMNFYPDSRRKHDETLKNKFIALLNQWIEYCSKIGNKQRAAAFIFEDQIIGRVLLNNNWTSDSSFRAQLQQLGVITKEGRTEGWRYVHSFLLEARKLDPNGLMGDLAVMNMMEYGFQLDVGCRDCGDCYKTVIAEGEKYLTYSKDDEFRNWTHLNLGYAYSAIVAIGNGISVFFALDGDSAKIEKRVSEARAEAIDHFRLAFISNRNSLESREAWRYAWRLVATIPPQYKKFTCVDE